MMVWPPFGDEVNESSLQTSLRGNADVIAHYSEQLYFRLRLILVILFLIYMSNNVLG